ncbi:MAG TPA: hypothetical protein PKV98_04450 [Burkholderiaceae bacterium]|nr:hypothetical protein [Burkholderiaceae bacterium]
MTAPPREPDAWMVKWMTEAGTVMGVLAFSVDEARYHGQGAPIPLYAAPAPSAEPIKNRVSDGSRQFPPNRDPGRVSLPMKGNDDDESDGRRTRGVAGEGDGNHLRSGCRDGAAGRDRAGEHDAGLQRPQQHADRCGGNATRLLIDNETLRQQIAADPDDSEPSAGSVEPPAQAATDDLTRDCDIFRNTPVGHTLAAARALIDRQAREIESLRAECGLRQIQGYNEGKEAASARLYEAEAEQLTRDMRQRAERAEAERDALRECVRAADAMRERMGKLGWSGTADAYDAARAKVKP